MNSRFYLIIALLIILYGAWANLAHSHGSSTGDRYEALAKLPVYAYVADTTKVASIVSGLENISGIATYTHETGYQAARELIKAYGLPLTEDTIAEYSFPDLITVNFLPARSIISAKASTLICCVRIGRSDLVVRVRPFGKSCKSSICCGDDR
jgi:cell division protein FtsX